MSFEKYMSFNSNYATTVILIPLILLFSVCISSLLPFLFLILSPFFFPFVFDFSFVLFSYSSFISLHFFFHYHRFYLGLCHVFILHNTCTTTTARLGRECSVQPPPSRCNHTTPRPTHCDSPPCCSYLSKLRSYPSSWPSNLYNKHTSSLDLESFRATSTAP